MSGSADRVDRAIDHVLANLARPLPLEEVARAASLSPFHFHRVFKAMMGETLADFVRRVRLEKALSLMSRSQGGTLTQIALACGFASSSDFSRSFRQRYGVPPSRFPLGEHRDGRREELLALLEQAGARPAIDRLPPGENPDGFEVELVRLPPRTLAYRRVFDPYHGTGVIDAARELVAWAEQRGLADGRWSGFMWEDPDIVALEDCRYDVAVEVQTDQVKRLPDGPVGRLDFPAMLVAQVEIAGDIGLELRALDWLYGTWLPASGRIPDDQPGFEVWKGRPFAHGHEHFELALQLPVR